MHGKRLNNLVTELATAADLSADGGLCFENPREGWVFIGLASGDAVLDGTTVLEGGGETMRYLDAGPHDLQVEGGPTTAELSVRTVPELAYCKFVFDPHVKEYGPYNADFLAKHVFPHCNTVVGSASPETRAYAEKWKAAGGRWIIECPLPGLSAETVDFEDVYNAWSTNPGMADPLYDGVVVDEFFSGDNPKYRQWTDAMNRVLDENPGKRFYPYLGSHWPDKDDWHRGGKDNREESSKAFLGTALKRGQVIAWERYVQERHEQQIGAEFIQRRLGEPVKRWQEVFPGSPGQLLVTFGYMTITETLSVHPSVNYKVFMDMQFNFVANRPEFDGLYGIMEYTAGYADEETVRWAARLYRHYGIEGNTDMLTERLGWKYKSDHIYNPEFNFDLEGWDVPIWIERNVAARSVPGFGHIEGRWPRTSAGDTFLYVERSDERPNALSQPIRNLEPGKLYSVKMISGDYGDLVAGRSEEKQHGLSLSVDGADVIAGKTFRSVVANNYAHMQEPFTTAKPFWLNFHQLVFRAGDGVATLSISDWATDEEPGGPIGQELMCNNVELHPYFDESGM